MDILKIKNNRDLLNREVRLIGSVVASFATNMGWWIKVADSKNYRIFVFSPQYNFRPGDKIVAKGVVSKNDLYGIFIQGTRVLRRQVMPQQQMASFYARQQQMMQQQLLEQAQNVDKKGGFLSKIDPKLLILVAVLFSLIAGFFLYPMLSGV